MSTEGAPGRLTLLLVLAGVLLLGSGFSYYLLQSKAESGAAAVPVAALFAVAIDADAAVTGEPQALAPPTWSRVSRARRARSLAPCRRRPRVPPPARSSVSKRAHSACSSM